VAKRSVSTYCALWVGEVKLTRDELEVRV
jgi:hypothetical protein